MSVYFTRRGPAPTTGKLASDYAAGDVVKILENGTAVEYIVVQQGLPGEMYDASCDGTWVLRKECSGRLPWDSTGVNNYGNSTINAYLNGEYLDRFDTATKNAMKTCKIPYCVDKGSGLSVSSGQNGLSVRGFLFSAAECSFNFANMLPDEGSELSYFKGLPDVGASRKRVAYKDGSPETWWIRSPFGPEGSAYSSMSLLIQASGDYYFSMCSVNYGIRPVHILRYDAVFNSNNVLEG